MAELKNKVADSAFPHQNSSECRKLLRTTFFLLSVVGFDFCANPSFFRKCFSYILRFIIFSFICYCIAIYVPFFLTTAHKTIETWNFMLFLTEICLVSSTYILSTIKWRSLFRAITVCLTNCEQIIGNHIFSYKKIRRNIRLSYFYLLFVLVLFSFRLAYLGYSYNPTKKFLSSNDTDQFEIFSTSEVQEEIFDERTYMAEMIFLVSIFLLFSIHLLFVLLYTSMCNVVSQSFGKLTEITEAQNASFIEISFASSNNQGLLKNHQELCEVVRSLDDVFKQMVAIWHLAELINAVFLLKSCQLDCNLERIGGVIIVSSFYFNKCFAAANVNENIIDSLNSVLEKRNGNKSLNKIDLEMEMYGRATVLDPPAFTGWGLYVINRGFILSSIGSVVTYVLVVYNIK